MGGNGSGRWPLGSQTTRVNWSMRHSAKTIAELAGEGEGFSQGGYVSKIIEQRRATWIDAEECLHESGWTKGEVRKALSQIAHPQAFPRRPKRTVTGQTGVEVGDTIARALLVLAGEIAAGNAEVVRKFS